MTSTKPDPRRAARELVLQGLYQRQLSGNSDEAIRASLLESDAFPAVDAGYFTELWHGVTAAWEALLALMAPHSTRAVADLSPIERAIVAIGAWELGHKVEVPYKVVINEAVELAKSYGGTDGHKFVNGVLDKVARDVRAAEIAALARERRGA
jgi:transcription antitermination protein NusB